MHPQFTDITKSVNETDRSPGWYFTRGYHFITSRHIPRGSVYALTLPDNPADRNSKESTTIVVTPWNDLFWDDTWETIVLEERMAAINYLSNILHNLRETLGLSNI